MKSILQDENDKRCFLCGGYGAFECHHIFGGAYRKKSEKYGLKVRLHHSCHNEPPNGVHHNIEAMQQLRRIGQRAAMQHYGWITQQFVEIFGKNYL